MTRKIEKELQYVLEEWLDIIVPESMTPKEKRDLAKKAHVNIETVRRAKLRGGRLTGENLILLLLARGVNPKVLVTLPRNNTVVMTKDEKEWERCGREMTSTERMEYAAIVRYLRSHFGNR